MDEFSKIIINQNQSEEFAQNISPADISEYIQANMTEYEEFLKAEEQQKTNKKGNHSND